MPGKRVSYEELAKGSPAVPTRGPTFSTQQAPIGHVTANPRNRRRLDPQSPKQRELVESIREIGQLQPCAAVTRKAYVAAFPEDDSDIPTDAWYVLAMGERRRAGVLEVAGGDPDAMLAITVNDKLAADRATFLAATAAENIDRQGLNPIEEAEAVHDLADELGTGKAAAAKLAKTAAWVTQRLNLLKLAPAVQDMLRGGEVSVRLVRDLHTLAEPEQLAELVARRAAGPETASANDGDEPGEKPTKLPEQRVPAVVRAINRIGKTPEAVARTFREQWTAAEVKELVRLLSEGL